MAKTKVEPEETKKKPLAAEKEPKVEAAKEDKTPAKAGKRSAKSISEADAAQAKKARKDTSPEPVAKGDPKKPNPPKSKLDRAGRKYREAAKQIDSSRTYDIADAISLALKASPAKFDETLELHVNLNVDPKQADQNIRGSVVLPSGTGKSLKIAVLADDELSKKAKAAGADEVDADMLLQELENEKIVFDILIATPMAMPKLGKFAKLLGPKGLMPNPKSGTVTNDVAKAVTEARAGKVEFRVDSYGIVHVPLGKKSFGHDKLAANAEAVISIKGIFLRSASVCTTMGPSIKATI
jgi:large subunit ribosomal protein L1